MPPTLTMAPRTESIQKFDTMLKVISPERVISAEQAEAAQIKAEAEQNVNEPVNMLANRARLIWNAAVQAKQMENEDQGSVDDRLLQSVRKRLGVYDPDKLAEIKKFGGSDIYMMITNIKCRAAEAHISGVMLPPGEIPWDMEPSTIPELPEAERVKVSDQISDEAAILMDAGQEISLEDINDRLMKAKEARAEELVEKAKVATRFQKKKIEDEFQQGGFYHALKDFISDISTFPAAFIEGPFIRRERQLTWVQDNKGKWLPKIQPNLVRKYARISPFDMYPSPGAKHIQDGDLCIRRRLRPDELHDMIGVPGFSEQNIRGALKQHGEHGLGDWLYSDQERAEAYGRPDERDDPAPIIDAVEIYTRVQGSLLREWGMEEKKVPDPEKSYPVNIWLVGQWVICARLNPHPLGKRNIYSAAYEQVVDSIWGKCPPELMADLQDMCNAAARHAVNNMAIASGPLVEANMDRVEPGEDVEDIYPWKVLKSHSDPMGAPGPAYQFFQPDPMTDELMGLYDKFFNQASEQTGIPQYIYGSERGVGGAGETASGLSMLMNAAGKVLMQVVKNIDERIIKPVVKEHWMHIMLYDDDEYKIGDINIVARASEYMVMEEIQQIRMTEYLNSTNNDWDRAIIGDMGRAELQRHFVSRFLKIPVKDVIPTREKMEERAQAMAEQAQAQMEAEAEAQASPEAGGQPGPGPALNMGNPAEMTRMAA